MTFIAISLILLLAVALIVSLYYIIPINYSKEKLAIRNLKNAQTKNLPLSILLFIALTPSNALAQVDTNEQGWQQYANVREVGFSPDSLASLTRSLNNSKSAVVMVTYKGNVLFTHGDVKRRYAIHSMRKGLMNAMIGIEEKEGTLNLHQSLSDLGIDDIGKLTSDEKKTTINNLLSARGGVYHPSAYYEKNLIKLLPERGSNKPGSTWIYNNWDFNVLHTIYEKQSGKNFFQAFEIEIANQIGMEDFRSIDTYLMFENDKSVHPAYLFKMSSRDLARIGTLYLNQGKWGREELIPKEWIKKSTSTVTSSEDLGRFKNKGSYGLLWWVDKVEGRKTYYASGAGGHRVIIIPEEDMVIVHRVNTYEGEKVGVNYINSIISKILKAKNVRIAKAGSPAMTSLILRNKSELQSVGLPMEQFLGTYTHQLFGDMEIQKQGRSYQLHNGLGIFNLFITSASTFYIEDMEIRIRMVKLEDPNQVVTIKPVMSKERKLEEVVFFFK